MKTLKWYKPGDLIPDEAQFLLIRHKDSIDQCLYEVPWEDDDKDPEDSFNEALTKAKPYTTIPPELCKPNPLVSAPQAVFISQADKHTQSVLQRLSTPLIRSWF